MKPKSTESNGWSWRMAPERAVRFSMTIAGIAAVLLGLWRLRPPATAREANVPTVNTAQFDSSVRGVLDAAFEKVRKHPRSAPDWGRLGMTLRAYELLPEAKHCLREAMRLDPNDIHWPYLLAQFATLNTAAETESLLSKAVSLGKDTTTLPKMRLAEFLMEAGRWDEGRRILDELGRSDADSMNSTLLHARLRLAEGDIPSAIRLTTRLTNSPAHRRAAARMLAQLHRRNGDSTAANETARFAESLPADIRAPDELEKDYRVERVDPVSQSDAIQPLLARGQFDEASRRIERLLIEHPKFAEGWLLAGRLRLQQRNPTSAETNLLKHLELDSNSIQGWFQLGLARLQSERYEDALTAFSRSINLKPNFSPAHFNRSLCLLNLGRTNEAIGSLDQSIRHNPEHIEAYLTLADLHFRTGNLDAGFLRLHQARQLNPSDPRLHALMERAGNRTR